MKQSFLLLILFTLMGSSVSAQLSKVGTRNVREINTQESLGNGLVRSEHSFGREAKPTTYFIDDHYRLASLVLGKKTKNAYTDKIKIDYLNNEVVYQDNGKEYSIGNLYLDSIHFKNSNHIYEVITIDNSRKICELVYTGEDYKLYKYFKIIEMPATYNPALNVGTQTVTYKHKKIFVLSKNEQLLLLPKSKKKRRKKLAENGVVLTEDLKAAMSKKNK